MKINELQKREAQLGVYQTAVALMTPLFLTYFVGSSFARIWIAVICSLACGIIIFMQARRVQHRQNIREAYENLEAGIVLKSRFANSQSNQYIITQSTPQYYHLKGLKSDKQFVLARKKAIDSYFVDSTNQYNSQEMARSKFAEADQRS